MNSSTPIALFDVDRIDLALTAFAQAQRQDPEHSFSTACRLMSQLSLSDAAKALVALVEGDLIEYNCVGGLQMSDTGIERLAKTGSCGGGCT